LPDLPVLGDFVAGYESSAWYGLGAPKHTPSEIVATLNTEINAGLANSTIKARLADLAGWLRISWVVTPPPAIAQSPTRPTATWGRGNPLTAELIPEGIGVRGISEAVAHKVLLVVVPAAAAPRLDAALAVEGEHVV
jgi:hypothetical protein